MSDHAPDPLGFEPLADPRGGVVDVIGPMRRILDAASVPSARKEKKNIAVLGGVEELASQLVEFTVTPLASNWNLWIASNINAMSAPK